MCRAKTLTAGFLKKKDITLPSLGIRLPAVLGLAILVHNTLTVGLEKEKEVINFSLDDLPLVGVADLDPLRVGIYRHHVRVHIAVLVNNGINAGEGVMLGKEELMGVGDQGISGNPGDRLVGFGDAAVNAGIVSPIVVIIIALTSICGLLFTDVDFTNALRGWRIFFILCASIMGIVGIVAGGIIFVAKLASLESLGTPYLTPFSPLNLQAQKDNVIRTSRDKLRKRPSYLAPKNQTRLQVNYDEN